jgi:hypothetical protein
MLNQLRAGGKEDGTRKIAKGASLILGDGGLCAAV